MLVKSLPKLSIINTHQSAYAWLELCSYFTATQLWQYYWYIDHIYTATQRNAPQVKTNAVSQTLVLRQKFEHFSNVDAVEYEQNFTVCGSTAEWLDAQYMGSSAADE